MGKNLLTIKQGHLGRIKFINAGRGATRRLLEMGFNPGAPVRVIKNDAGPVIVSLSGNKIAIGRGLAQKIQLEPYKLN